MESTNIELQDRTKEKEQNIPFYDDCYTPIMMEKKLSNISGENQDQTKVISFTNPTIILFCIMLTMMGMCYSIAAPFLPSESASIGVSQSYLGFMFSALPFSFALAAPSVGKFLAQIGRRNIIIIGCILLGISCGLCGYLEYVSSPFWFVSIFIFCRLLMGIGVCSCQTASYAILTLLYPTQISKAVAIIEGSVGIGLAFGPGFGSAMYYLFGFKGPFYGLGIICLIITLFIKKTISDEVETNMHNTFHVSKSVIIEAIAFSSPVTYTNILKNHRVIFALLSAFFNIWQFTFIEPFFADYLNVQFGLYPETCGLMFLFIGLGYAISCQVVSRITHIFKFRKMIIFGLLLIGFFTSFYAPSTLYGVGSHEIISSIALFCAGLSSAFCLIPVIPEIIDQSVSNKEFSDCLSNQNHKDLLNDHISGLYNFVFACGNTLGPMLGNTMYVNWGCASTCDFFGFSHYHLCYKLLFRMCST